jgi:putative pyruvate formate lyase activating enzyme
MAETPLALPDGICYNFCMMDHLLESCTLCPRRGGVHRLAGETGYCGAKKEANIARAALHHWEEPCISGETGSGTVFFSFCTMRCVFCQNALFDSGKGKDVAPGQLGQIFLDLQEQKANNINLVTPTHYMPQIAGAVDIAKAKGLSIPIVYNTSGFETTQSIEYLKNTVDIFLPDFKYFDDSYARKYSGVPTYVEYASSAIRQMVMQTGPAIFDGNGIMRKGVIVRHLVLPGLIEDAKNVIRYVYETFGDDVYLSIMNQYTPLRGVQEYPEINKTVDPADYEAVVEYALSLGVVNGFIQEEGTVGESFIPEFTVE